MKNLILASLLLVLLGACAMPNILVSDELKNGTQPMDVKGRQGWNFNQVLRYGQYTTSEVKRGWTRSSEINFVLRFQRASQKLSFVQYGPGELSAEVFTVGEFKNNEIDLLDNFLSYSVKYKNTYAGTIVLPNDANEWEFVVNNPEASDPDEAELGSVRDKQGRIISIRGVKEFDGRKVWGRYQNYGFEFSMQGRALGAVSIINAGMVWLHPDLDAELRIVTASLASALLLRQSMRDAVR